MNYIERMADLFQFPILKGKLRNKKWIIAAGGKTLRILLSTYEPAQTKLFEKLISKDSVVLDIGANIGYYSLLSSTLVGDTGKIYSFEPNPINIRYLKKHVKVNKIKNIEVIESAASNENGKVFFENNSGRGTGHISQDGSIEVKTIRLDDFIQQNNIVPTHLKIDVEGAELSVLKGAEDLLNNCKPVIFLSTHGKEIRNQCCEFLKSLNYEMKSINGKDLFSTSDIVCYPNHKA